MSVSTAAALKKKRSHARTKATKAINAASKLVKEDLTIIRITDLAAKVEAAKIAIDEHSETHEEYVDAMESEHIAQVEIQGEKDANSIVEAGYEQEMDKLSEILSQAQLCAKNVEIQRDATLWHKNSTTKSSNFAADGAAQKQEMSKLIKELTPYRSVVYFKDQLIKAETLLEQVSTKLYSAEDSIPETAASAITSVSSSSRLPPYKVIPPRFSGKPKEFHIFKERFSDIMEKHKEFYSDADKVNILAESMDDIKAKQMVVECYTTGYEEAMEQLEINYGRKSVIFPLLIEDLVKREKIDYTSDGMKDAIDRTQKVLDEMERIEAKDIELLAVAMAIKDFDVETRTEWTKQLGSTDELPTLEKFLEFVLPLSRNLPRRSSRNMQHKFQHSKYQHHHHHGNNNSGATNSTTSSTTMVSTSQQDVKQEVTTPAKKKPCPICKDEKSHPTYRCKKFKEGSVLQRLQWVKQNKLCPNCLHNSHSKVEDCTSTYSCKHCRGKHNYLLHQDTDGVSLATTVDDVETKLPAGFIHTALISLQYNGEKITARAALDSCSSHSMITEAMASYLQVKREPLDLVMVGAVAQQKIKHCATVNVTTVIPSSMAIPIDVAISPSLPYASPPKNPAAIAAEEPLKGLSLADPYLGGKIDVIIGTNDLPLFWTNDEKKFCAEARITAINTVFGWSVSGPAAAKAATTRNGKNATTLKVELVEDEDSKLFRTMYELEQVPKTTTWTANEQSAVNQFNATIKQHQDGRYSCKLPQVKDPPSLGDSMKMAKARFFQNERKMKKLGHLDGFNQEMLTYLTMNHAQEVPPQEMDKEAYYLPVQGVIKMSSTSTKIRPVFDGSAKTASGNAVNDLFLVGPNLYPLIADVLIKFRTKKVGLTADISKMYREVKLERDDQDWHRFFCRDSSGRLIVLRMTRLTFGIRPSPFVATSVIRLHAKKYMSSYPEAAKAILSTFYVDDFISGADSVSEATALQQSLCKVLQEAGMQLRKWRSSSQEVMETIPMKLREENPVQEIYGKDVQKALGVHWNTGSDSLHVATPTIHDQGEVTKRVVAKGVASVFDVLGLVAPFHITGKIVLQSLWAAGTKWDEAVSLDISLQWQKWCEQLQAVNNHPIPRFAGAIHGSTKLHGFCDSSTKAFAAVIFLSNDDDLPQIVHAKARVCPLKQRTLPEMELESARMLAQLLKHVAEVLGVPLCNCHAWSDSAIVLAWLKKPLHKLVTFVANRVAAIMEALPNVTWHHVSSGDNPADLPSRGVAAEVMMSSHLWWHGPPWLAKEEEWPRENGETVDVLPGIKKDKAVAMLAVVDDFPLWSKFSCYDKLTRVLAWMLKFIQACKTSPKKDAQLKPHPPANEPHPPVNELHLTYDNLQSAKYKLIKLQQIQSFTEEYAALIKNNAIPKSSCLAGLCSSIHEHAGSKVIVSRGRVQSRLLFPLAANNGITSLMLQTRHKDFGHAGVSTLISILGHQHYIIGIKRKLKAIARKCVKCQRINAHTMEQQMGMLPSCRTNLKPPFAMTGMDFCGPITLREGATRKPVLKKSYLCIFVCMATKAVHIEICRSLDTEEFMAAFARMINRRGCPEEVWSDNGTNFVGAEREIRKLAQVAQSKHHNIKWHFSPPRAPNFGGLWEAGVKSVKKLISKIVQPHPLRWDEMFSITCEVEALLNSRPLVPAEEIETDDGLVITPGHFLVYRPLKAPPTSATPTAKISSLRRWQLVKRLSKELEHAWKGCYINSLQSRNKWCKGKLQPMEGQLVYIKDETLMKTNRWPLGKIKTVYPGKDGTVRVVDVMCGQKIYKRASSSLIPLFVE